MSGPAFRRALGVEISFDDRADTVALYTRNVSAIERQIAGVVRPKTTREVAQVVVAANQAGTALYPIATGANWGLGSRLPVRDGAVIVDLGAMNAIDVDRRAGVAVIEPGVTQRALANALLGTRFVLDVTGSGADTSILGNALDRGIAHFGSRADTTRVHEAVLGSGEIVSFEHGGAGHSELTRLYAHGLGPAVHALFFQSNFGIVTRASVRLRPRAPNLAVVRAGLRDEGDLGAFIDAAKRLVDEGVLPPALHISNRARARSVFGGALAVALGPREAARALDQHSLLPWSLSCPITGHAAQVEVAARIARRALARWGPVTIVREPRLAVAARIWRALDRVPWCRRRAAALDLSLATLRHASGVPSDVALASIPWALEGRTSLEPDAVGTTVGSGSRTAETTAPPAGRTSSVAAEGGAPNEGVARSLDEGSAGTLFVLPLVPIDGAHVTRAIAIIDRIANAHSRAAYVTLNAAGAARAFEVVLNVTFRRDDARDVAGAHACAAALSEALDAAGYAPYRVGIHEMTRIVDPASPFWALAERLKRVFDPSAVIAPGRYGLS